MTKGGAWEAAANIVASLKQEPGGTPKSSGFVGRPPFAFYSRKWKHSPRETNVNRISVHLVSAFADRELLSFQREEIQRVLDAKAFAGPSFSVVDHLQWDLKQIFDMAVMEGHIRPNPAAMLFYAPRGPKPGASGHDDW